MKNDFTFFIFKIYIFFSISHIIFYKDVSDLETCMDYSLLPGRSFEILNFANQNWRSGLCSGFWKKENWASPCKKLAYSVTQKPWKKRKRKFKFSQLFAGYLELYISTFTTDTPVPSFINNTYISKENVIT